MRWRVLLIFLAISASSLRSELLPIRTYTTADGLALDRVDRIVADSRGFLWFCTWEGLSRFDGYRFVSYDTRDGLPNQMATSFLETRSGDYLVGTARGVCQYNAGRSGRRFTTYAPGKERREAFVEALFESRSGRLWCGTEGGLFEMSPYFHFTPRRLAVSGRINAGEIAEDPRGNLWVATSSGAFVIASNGSVQRFTMRNGLPGDWVNTLFIDRRGGIWLGMRGGLALIRELPRPWAWEVEKVYTDKQGLAGLDIQAIVQASDGTIWIATENGISRLLSSDDTQPVFQNLSRANGLADREILALAEDKAGNIWAGTQGAGVMKINRLGFTTFHEMDGLRSDRIWSTFENRDGTLIVITESENQPGRTLNVFDGHRFHVVAPRILADHPVWGTQQIFLQSRTREWWAATRIGLCRFSAVAITQLGAKQPRACFSNDEVFRIFEDSRGAVWASAQSQSGDRLMRWNPKKGTVSYFAPSGYASSHPSLFGELVSAFAEDRKGNVWMGLYSGDVYRYDGREFKRFGQSEGVPAGIIYSLFLDHRGSLWIGSGSGGLGRIQDPGAEHVRVEVYDNTRGLVSNSIRCIVEDNQGQLYVGTGRGVDRLDPSTGRLKHFSAADGLARGEMISAFRDRSGALWFGTTQGLSRLLPTKERPRAPPPVLITDMRVGGVLCPVSQVGETHVSGLQLTPSHNQLQVEFVGLDYEPGESLRYSYKLEGADENWSAPRGQHMVNYAALGDGTYRFLVKALNSEGVESAVPAEIDFTVLPPLWKRWWFETLALGLASALVFAAHRYRVAQLMTIERMRTGIATDLHDDIGAGLSQIAILAEVARVNDGQGRQEEPMRRVAAVARELVDSMSDIVWAIRSESGGMDALIRRMRQFGFDLLASQGILFELRAPENATNVQLSLQARRQLFLIYKECIHNAARHSGGSEVAADLKVDVRQAVLTVTDNGAGMKCAASEPRSTGGTGIPSMRQRAASLGGNLEVRSTPGQGCTLTITVPIRRTAFGKPKL